MQVDSIIQAAAAGIVIVVNCMTVGIGLRACRDIYRRLRVLEARVVAPPQVMYMPFRQDYYPPPAQQVPIAYDPV